MVTSMNKPSGTHSRHACRGVTGSFWLATVAQVECWAVKRSDASQMEARAAPLSG